MSLPILTVVLTDMIPYGQFWRGAYEYHCTVHPQWASWSRGLAHHHLIDDHDMQRIPELLDALEAAAVQHHFHPTDEEGQQ